MVIGYGQWRRGRRRVPNFCYFWRVEFRIWNTCCFAPFGILLYCSQICFEEGEQALIIKSVSCETNIHFKDGVLVF